MVVDAVCQYEYGSKMEGEALSVAEHCYLVAVSHITRLQYKENENV